MPVLLCLALLLALSVAQQVTTGPSHKIYSPGAAWYINDHTIIYGPGGKWHMFGITHTDPADGLCERNFAHATSTNLTGTWKREPFAFSAKDPELFLWAPHAIKYNDQYHIFYCGGGLNREKYLIDHKISSDLWTWTQQSTLFTGGVDGRDPMVLDLGQGFPYRFIIYYCGTVPNDARVSNVSHVTYYRTSNDLVHWSDYGVAFDGGIDGSNFGGPTESPFVVRRGPHFYLLSGAWDGNYTLTRVFYSQDPINFGSAPKGTANKVGTINSHAPEVIRDVDGKWYVSSGGWGRGGLSIAELFFHDGCDTCATSLPIPTYRAPSPDQFETNLKAPWTQSDSSIWSSSPSGLWGENALDYSYITSATKMQDVNCTMKVELITLDGNPGCGVKTNWTRSGSAAMLTLRVQNINNPSEGSYIIGLFTNGLGVQLIRMPDRKVLASYPTLISSQITYTLRVITHGSNIKVWLNDGATPVIDIIAAGWKEGYIGMGVWQSAAKFMQLITSTNK
jgi:arabinan endo-1,5-alpha-L-arabinosidase